MNACPARYRNLTPQAECQLRGMRLGTVERPGAKPSLPDNAFTQARSATLRDLVLAHIKDGYTTRVKLRKKLNAVAWVDVALGSLLAANAIIAIRGQNDVRSEVAK